MEYCFITICLFFPLVAKAIDPILVIEVSREGLTTPKNPLISKKQGLKLTEYNDSLSEYGKRQQYLLGLEMRIRYGGSIFRDKCNPLNIYAYSVNKQSIMLSGQIQLFGICPIGSNEDVTPEMVGKAFPPFDFPEKDKIAAELGLHATPFNFMPLPLHSTYDDPIFGNRRTIPESDLPYSHIEDYIDEIFYDSLYCYLNKLAGEKFTRASEIIDTANELIWLYKTQETLKLKKDKIKLAEEFIFLYYTNYWNRKNRIKYVSMFFKNLLIKLKDAVIVELNKYNEEKILLKDTEESLNDYDINQIKFYLFAVGDLQMYTYIKELELGNKDYIPPSSILLFELRKVCDLREGMSIMKAMKCYRLNIKFNDKEVDSPYCSSPCILNEFYKKLNKSFDLL